MPNSATATLRSNTTPNNPPPDLSDSVSVPIEGELHVEFDWTDDGTPRRLPVKDITRVLLKIDGEQIDVTGSPILGRSGLDIQDLTIVETALEQAVTLDERDADPAADQERDSIGDGQ